MSNNSPRQLLQNESRGSSDAKRKLWNYPDPSINIPQTPNRACSSPVEQPLEVMVIIPIKKILLFKILKNKSQTNFVNS